MLTTTYINVNFNKMLETLIFQQSYVKYLKSSNKQIIKSGSSASKLSLVTKVIIINNYWMRLSMIS